MKRRIFLASGLATALAGCDAIANKLNDAPATHGLLRVGEKLNHAVIGTRGRARLYSPADITVDFPVNGLATPAQDAYQRLVAGHFADYRLPVSGLAERPRSFGLRELRALASVDEITRHDCVEGWSAIGRWRGVPLGTLLGLVRPKPEARYVVFYSFDRDDNGQPFYGSLDLAQAAHPQTQLALDLNGKPIDADHGGPVRLRVPTQLAYKSTKWVQRIELASTLAHAYGGNGGYWEDQGYEWYAGI